MNLADRLRKAGGFTEDRLLHLKQSLDAGVAPDEALEESGLLADDNSRQRVASFFGMDAVQGELVADKGFLAKFPARLLLRCSLLPVAEREGAVVVAQPKVFDRSALDELSMACGRLVVAQLGDKNQIDKVLKESLGVGADTMQTLVSRDDDFPLSADEFGDDIDLSDEAQEASIIRFVNQVLAEAIGLRATDVHFEPFEHEFRVRYRVDGILREAVIPPDVRRFRSAIVSRLKIISQLDIAEKRVPQDGRIKLRIDGREVDVRVSIIPMLHGEAVVLRLLDRSSAMLGLEQLGMSDPDCARFDEVLRQPHGIMLVTGPTGSGKTTTLYAALERINDTSRKIITIEDPVEYHLFGINQIQVNEKAGLTFASGLRSILRHDPDVVLIGEIRDMSTAEIAVQASLTGHLVFSTLHTNDAPGAITRLIDMGVEPYLVASTLEAVLAQRLVRLICPHCKRKLTAQETASELLKLNMSVDYPLYAGEGCPVCQGSGHTGRSAIIEFMRISDAIREQTLKATSTGELRKIARREGMRSLREDGLRVLERGETTVEELIRVTMDEARGGVASAAPVTPAAEEK